jgi:hypothetical protein
MKLNLVEIYGKRIPILEDFPSVERELESTLVFLGTDHGFASWAAFGDRLPNGPFKESIESSSS